MPHMYVILVNSYSADRRTDRSKIILPDTPILEIITWVHESHPDLGDVQSIVQYLVKCRAEGRTSVTFAV